MSLSREELDRLESIEQKLETLNYLVTALEASNQQIIMLLLTEKGIQEIEKDKKKKRFFW